ncbi:MAG: hypothetical protein AAGE65_08830 [Planctomycetota bacterium]
MPENQNKPASLHRRITACYGVPKSASRQTANMLARLQPEWRDTPRKAVSHLDYPGQTKEYDLLPLVGQEMPAGGVLHIQGWPNVGTLRTVRELKINLALVLRHPADQICAQESHVRHMRFRQLEAQGLAEDEEALQRELAGVTVDTLIRNGRLARNLWFMCEWLRATAALCDDSDIRVAVVRYEDVMADLPGTLRQAGDALFDPKPRQDQIAHAAECFQFHEAKLRLHANPHVYRFGSSGRVGLHRDYFDDAGLAAFREVVGHVLAIHPAAKHLCALYPSLPGVPAPVPV